MKTMEETREIAITLYKMQHDENLCRGIDCVKTLIMYLDKGQWDKDGIKLVHIELYQHI